MFSALSTSLYVCVVLCVQPSAHTHTHKTPRAPRARAESDTDYYVCSSVCPRALMFTEPFRICVENLVRILCVSVCVYIPFITMRGTGDMQTDSKYRVVPPLPLLSLLFNYRTWGRPSRVNRIPFGRTQSSDRTLDRIRAHIHTHILTQPTHLVTNDPFMLSCILAAFAELPVVPLHNCRYQCCTNMCCTNVCYTVRRR